MDITQIVALVGAAGMFIAGVGGFVVSLMGQRLSGRQARATSDNLLVDTVNDALQMARTVYQEKIASLEVALAEERAYAQARADALERRIEALSSELGQVRAAQMETDSRAMALQARVQELEAENATLRAFAEQLKIRNEALERRLGAA